MRLIATTTFDVSRLYSSTRFAINGSGIDRNMDPGIKIVRGKYTYCIATNATCADCVLSLIRDISYLFVVHGECGNEYK